MSTRLWFRVDDVLPLADHAMACPTHRITDAQARARTTLGPALIWTSNATLDALTSNGVPAWYGERGTTHAAEAHAWRHTGTGRYGTAWSDSYTTAFLPLTALFLDALRHARHDGRHWITIDIHPGDTHLIAPGRVRVVEYRDQLIPDGGRWMPAPVASSSTPATYPALVADGYTSDAGFALPRFDRAVVEQMVADLDAVHADRDRRSDPMPGEYPHLRWHHDVLIVLEEHDTGETITYRQVDQVRPDADGRYPVGAYLWDWHPTDAHHTPADGAGRRRLRP